MTSKSNSTVSRVSVFDGRIDVFALYFKYKQCRLFFI